MNDTMFYIRLWEMKMNEWSGSRKIKKSKERKTINKLGKQQFLHVLKLLTKVS